MVVSTCRTITDANLTAAHAPESRYGQPHAIDVSVTGAAEPGAGTVTVKEGSDVVGTAVLSAGAAAVTLPRR